MTWLLSARCRDHDPDLFFTTAPGSERRAKTVCRPCPVRSECLAFALDAEIEHGVWGGMNVRERRRLRAVPRGRRLETVPA